tara:strand:+ start:1119 stop:1727 length:609 start_codon:yes stop_codon:yes gene_type:complete
MTYPRHRASSAGRVDHDPYTVFRRAFKTNATGDATIAFSVPTATPPTTATAGVHELESGKKLLLYPYGTDAAEQFRLSVQLWFPLYDKVEAVRSSEDVAWVPVAAAILDCTMNASIKPAAAAGPLATTDLFCNIIALAAGTTQGLVTRVADDMISSDGNAPTLGGSSITIDTSGAKYVQFFVDKDGGAGTPAASGNTLFAVI